MRTVEEMLRRRCSQRRRQQLLIACLGGFFWFGLLGRRLLGPFYILRFLKGRVVAPSCPQPSIDMTPIQIIAKPIICILVDVKDQACLQVPPSLRRGGKGSVVGVVSLCASGSAIAQEPGGR